MLLKACVGALGATLLVASPAFAVTIVNQDTNAHTLTIDRGAKETQKDMAPGATLKVDCPDKCGFRDEAYGFSRLADGDARLVIDKNAMLHFANGHGDLTGLSSATPSKS